MSDKRTTAQKRRQMYQEKEREHLRNMGLIQYALECVDKMKSAGDQFELTKWDKVAEKYINLSKRYLPELKAVELSGHIEVERDATELTDAELARIAASSSAGTADEADSEKQSTSVH